MALQRAAGHLGVIVFFSRYLGDLRHHHAAPAGY
jgi:hypothetical protein